MTFREWLAGLETAAARPLDPSEPANCHDGAEVLRSLIAAFSVALESPNTIPNNNTSAKRIEC